MKAALRLLFLIFVVLAGLRIQHWLILRGSMDLIHGDMGDARFNEILLEHSYRYFFDSGYNASFWSPFWVFFPEPNTLLYSDVIIASAINYIPFRLIGLLPDDAYQCWHLSNNVLNFAAMYFLLVALRIGFLSRVVGSWIFAFALIRGAYLPHAQLMPHYYVAFAGIAYIRGLTAKTPAASMFFGAMTGILLGLQFWVGLYLFWMSGFLALIGFALYLWLMGRKQFETFIKTHLRMFASALVSLAVIVGPLAIKYKAVQHLIGARKWRDVVGFLPGLKAFLLPPPDTWFYKSLFQANYNVSGWYSEMFLFPGFMAFGFVAAALFFVWKRRKESKVWMLAGVVWLCSMVSLNHEMWHMVYRLIPGADAIRSMGRMGVAGLLPLSICAAGATDAITGYIRGKTKFSTSVNIFIPGLILLLVVLDNGATFQYGFSKRENQIRIGTVRSMVVSGQCELFHFSSTDTPWKTEIDSMWASITSGVPTINGYSGNIPPGYSELGINAATRQTSETLEAWLVSHRANSGQTKICALP